MNGLSIAHTRPPVDSNTAEPIAIVGMASRLPGAPSLAAFWDLLRRGGDAISEDLPERLRSQDWSSVRRSTRKVEDRRLGGFLDRIDEFDAGFFGMSEREVLRTSPTQRLLFEVVWEALDDAGVPEEALAGTRTSVFTSCLLTPEYWNDLEAAGMADMYAVVGTATYATAGGRIAYALDLRGPTMTLEATCASSLLAVHVACASIRSGESESAIVGTVNLQLSPSHIAAMARGGVISPSGACKFADTGADGYAPSEGALAVLLKPLSTALADGDRVYAAILGGGASSIGRSANSLVSPSVAGQIQAITTAHAQAGVSVADIDYVEAHGSGTTRGDLAELTALGNVLRTGRDPSDPCLVGSVKSNIGHTEGAAGLAGLVKTALAVANRIIPPTLHVNRPNEVLTDDLPLSLVRDACPWPNRGPARIAGVSSFGMSGTNVHMVLTSVPPPPAAPRVAPPIAYLLPVSARSHDAVGALAGALAERLDEVTTLEELHDVVFSAGARRTHYDHRIAVVGADRDELAAGLREYAAGGVSESVVTGTDRTTTPPQVVFACSGNGARLAGAGCELLATSSAFLTQVQECDKAVNAELGWSVLDRLTDPTWLTRAYDTNFESRPVLWAMQVGLAAMWRDWGIEPDVVLGQGSGRLAAATIRGTMTVRDAAALMGQRDALPEDNVLFAKAVRATLDPDRHTLLVELGPEARLADTIEQTIAGANAQVISSLRPGEPEHRTMLTGLAAAYVHGARVDWAAVHPGGRYVSLPSYPWQRRQFWPTAG